MKLVYVQTREPMAVIEDKEITFPNKTLDHEMRTKGVLIPENLRPLYHNRKTLYPGDPGFIKAFIEIYLRYNYDVWNYRWVE